MTTINKFALVPYTPAQMFALVDDIEAYPQFLPWCKRTRVLSRTEDEVRATIELSRGGVEKAFTTCNRNQKDKMIEMRLVEGPFKRLDGFWRFDASDSTQTLPPCSSTILLTSARPMPVLSTSP